MDKNINIDHKLIEYIFSHTSNLHPTQKELIKYNENLGHIKRLQLSILQANFLQFLIKSRNINNCLEVGTFTGYSALSMALSLNKKGKILSIDKDKEKNKIAKSFFKKAKVSKKIKTEISNGNDALKKLIKNKKKINENNLEKYLHTNNIPDPDLLIRTGNTKRLSNFLLWQLAYSEISFEKKLWPDFNEKDYNKILLKFKKIKRNFGNI